MITMETVGKRVYLNGNTFPVKDALKRAGCHWDGDRRAWWIGVGKREAVLDIIGRAATFARAV